MRKTIVLMALGLFLSASAANACDGDKAVAKKTKGSKGACTMSKKACAVAEKAGKCDMKAMAKGNHDCCKKGASAKKEDAKTSKSEVKS